MKQLLLAFIAALILFGAAGCDIEFLPEEDDTTSSNNDDEDDTEDDDDDEDDDDHYSLACPYPTATASASDTGNIDCNCDSTYENESLDIEGSVSMSCSVGANREIISNSIPDHEPWRIPQRRQP